jgi:flagellar biogenesis protein FliO
MSGSRPDMVAQLPAISRTIHFLVSFVRSIKVRRTERALKLCESLALGEKRFLAVVQCEQERFLIGVTNQSVSLLRQLEPIASASVAIASVEPKCD